MRLKWGRMHFLDCIVGQPQRIGADGSRKRAPALYFTFTSVANPRGLCRMDTL